MTNLERRDFQRPGEIDFQIGISINLAIKGDHLAQRKIFANCYSYVMSIALRYMGSKEEAEEVLNDVFYKVFNKLESFDQNYSFKFWLRSICVNTCIDQLRRSRNEPIKQELSDNIAEQPHQDSPEISSDLLLVIQSLSPQYRAVFNLYVFEEYKHREIAALLGISEGTSKSNYARAKQIIKKNIRALSKEVGLSERTILLKHG